MGEMILQIYDETWKIGVSEVGNAVTSWLTTYIDSYLSLGRKSGAEEISGEVAGLLIFDIPV